MQYTSKIALLAVALLGTSAFALPFAPEAEYNVEAREVDNVLSAREFYDMYLQARADSLEFDARDYLDYLEARDGVKKAVTKPLEDKSSAKSNTPESIDNQNLESPIRTVKPQRSTSESSQEADTGPHHKSKHHQANTLSVESGPTHERASHKHHSKQPNLHKFEANNFHKVKAVAAVNDPERATEKSSRTSRRQTRTVAPNLKFDRTPSSTATSYGSVAQEAY